MKLAMRGALLDLLQHDDPKVQLQAIDRLVKHPWLRQDSDAETLAWKMAGAQIRPAKRVNYMNKFGPRP